jgi:membrane fusion protein (multidrug efflux system)
VPGTGSVFALLPPDNATGNFIHIVERVPVRIALRKEEILELPVRPGLSTVTAIDVSSEGQPVTASLVEASTQEYTTDIFAKEMADAESEAMTIIRDNLVPTYDALEGSSQHSWEDRLRLDASCAAASPAATRPPSEPIGHVPPVHGNPRSVH